MCCCICCNFCPRPKDVFNLERQFFLQLKQYSPQEALQGLQALRNKHILQAERIQDDKCLFNPTEALENVFEISRWNERGSDVDHNVIKTQLNTSFVPLRKRSVSAANKATR